MKKSFIFLYAILFVVSLISVIFAEVADSFSQIDEMIRESTIDEYYKQFLIQNPTLIGGGSQIFPVEGGWVAVGVGISEVKDDSDSVVKRNAITVAEANANKSVAEAIFGTKMNVQEAVKKKTILENNKATIAESFSSLTKEDIEGALRKSEQVGTWLSTDGSLLGAIVVVMSPKLVPIGLNADILEETNSINWKKVLEMRPRLIFGGVSLQLLNEKTQILVVGNAKLSGNPVKDSINAPLVAEIDARKRVMQYLLGLKTKNSTEIIKESLYTKDDDKQPFVKTIESIQNTSQETVKGAVKMMKKGIQWNSSDGKMLFSAFVVDATDIFKPK